MQVDPVEVNSDDFMHHRLRTERIGEEGSPSEQHLGPVRRCPSGIATAHSTACHNCTIAECLAAEALRSLPAMLSFTSPPGMSTG